MEPEGSLPHSQLPATCPYLEPAQSSPYPHIPLPIDTSKYYPPIYFWFSPVFSFLYKIELLIKTRSSIDSLHSVITERLTLRNCCCIRAV
jgi:hypothetical protein